jgi:small subunit ribosomal protein S8
MKNSTVKLFSSIRNNQGTRQLFVKNKNIKFCNNILKILICKGFINSYVLEGLHVKIFLKYYNDKPVIFKNILLNSKSSFISYISLCKLNKNYELFLLSTSRGILTDKEAIFFKLGGFIICKII